MRKGNQMRVQTPEEEEKISLPCSWFADPDAGDDLWSKQTAN